MRVLVTGGSGVLGSKLTEGLVKRGHETSYTFLKNSLPLEGASSHRLEISERAATTGLIKRVRPDFVIHTAAVPSVDLCETDKGLADRVNVDGTRNVIDGCRALGCSMVFISSAFVFDGSKDVYGEGDVQKPINYYGHTKVVGERMVSSSGLPFLILRTDQPYGWVRKGQKENAVVRLLRQYENGEEIREIVDWYNNPTFAGDFVEATLRLTEKGATGVYHLTGPEFLNRVSWAIKVADAFEKDSKRIKAVYSGELGLAARRPNARLGNEKARRATGVAFCDIVEGLERMKELAVP